MARLSIDGYGQLELNHVAFRRNGRVEAQCALDTACFSSSVPAENGMILRVKKDKNLLTFADASAANQLYALNYTAEHMYDERKVGLKDFCVVPGEVYPRVGYLQEGDIFTTNCVDFGTGSEAAIDSALASGMAYGGASTNGAIALSTAAPTVGPVLQILKKTTMPDGTKGYKFQVLAV